MDSTVHGILQTRILEWVAFPFSRGSSQPRDRTEIFSTLQADSWPGEPPGKPPDIQRASLVWEDGPGGVWVDFTSLEGNLTVSNITKTLKNFNILYSTYPGMKEVPGHKDMKAKRFIEVSSTGNNEMFISGRIAECMAECSYRGVQIRCSVTTYRVWGGGRWEARRRLRREQPYVYLCCYTAETNTILYSNYPPTKNKWL